ncbi:Streptomycin 3''-adenylyltransferase [Planococcus massiliensis]|uniref:Streptomycin 3''-adenylyltransferase n=1 Tax=Planococcus massiliensis TaxID=1499687 RepID=A0A098EQ01_9BACL|nr:nucleotidyltransferase domain-containing protein [Planococcus massiliensis]CEG23406.1 Streptomycin 3''-adenylyltransferase [Planococcus massiliensis]
MAKNLEKLSSEMENYLKQLKDGLESILGDEITGTYVHGSLALGGFNPERSDVDLMVVVRNPLPENIQKELAHYLLGISNHPHPIEISILAEKQLIPWKFPTPYEFHFSEYWRVRYEQELAEPKGLYFHSEKKTDPDLAAHITILHHCGICLSGKAIELAFPEVPKEDYLASLIGDYEECLQDI